MLKTLVILDWDDTLFPTNWVVRNKLNLKNPRVRTKYSYLFTRLDSCIHRLLTKFLTYGEVTIITNAMPGWIVTCLEVLPRTQDLVLDKIHVISARKLYQKKYQHVPTWKEKAFHEKYLLNYENSEDQNKKEPFTDDLTPHTHNIISIGDAEYEHLALLNLYTAEGYQPKKRILKSIRFLSAPNFQVVIDQLDVLFGCAHKICTSRKHMELCFSDKFDYSSPNKKN